ncbi:unnamed protein product [Cyprideis torosa]|uniref:Uncharacterized protein n=1 Tax=Cyprideis torosa TaxID=163714 RepID=A0A7R8ZJ89_9CRUS|nr:unnamed protein product [Cyprideis torosa]CAG0888065.1 unnamed protein product [Cyprideis torosa]
MALMYYCERRCDDTDTDFIEISDSFAADRKRKRLCGTTKPDPLRSEEGFFRLTFVSGPGPGGGTGFKAKYSFKDRANIGSNSRENPQSVGEMTSSASTTLASQGKFFTWHSRFLVGLLVQALVATMFLLICSC